LSDKGSLVGELESAELPVRTNIKHKIEHNKFAVFDDREIVSGSYNWTDTASNKNSKNCLFFKQPKTRAFSERFKYLWDLYGGGQ
jgi:phosphatidylserine/phosphatidylglycerophosphate/cardiolipin synthase-like enzyme